MYDFIADPNSTDSDSQFAFMDVRKKKCHHYNKPLGTYSVFNHHVSIPKLFGTKYDISSTNKALAKPYLHICKQTEY